MRETVARLSGAFRATNLYLRHQIRHRFDSSERETSPGSRFQGHTDGKAALVTVPDEKRARRLGLHVTDQELMVWRQRALEGPYRSKGDAMRNSPGDWERISRLARQFMADPQAVRWQGPTHGSECVVNSNSWPRDLSGAPPRMGGPEGLRDTAFYAMVAQPGDTGDMVEEVKRQLLWHTEQQALDFSNSSRWCLEHPGRGYHPAYQISAWLRKLTYGFDYSRIAAPERWSGAEEQQFLHWVEAAARWYLPQIDAHREGMWTPDDRPTRAAHGWGGPRARPIWANGPLTRSVQHRYNNHVNRYLVFVTDVGILTGNADMQEYGRRWIREFLKVCVYPQGGISEFYRWDDRHRGHSQGWKYGATVVGATMIIADHLARTGDYSGYLFQTTVGTPDTAGEVPRDGITEGGPKTLLTSARQVARFVDENSHPKRFACFDCSDPDRLLSSRDPRRGISRVEDWFLLQGNVFYRDDYLKAIFMRSLSGTPELPDDPDPTLGWVENGDAGTFPGVNFMFAQMDGQVWPYPPPVGAHSNSSSAPTGRPDPSEVS